MEAKRKICDQDSLVFPEFTGDLQKRKKTRNLPQKRKLFMKMDHVDGLETIFIDEVNMSLNLAPCQLRSTKKGYYLPLKYSQIINNAAKMLKFTRMKTIILVPKKLLNSTKTEFFDVVVLFKNKIAYVIAMLEYDQDVVPEKSSFPPYLLNSVLEDKIWKIYDENGNELIKREDLCKASKIVISDPLVKAYKIGAKTTLVKNELILNGILLPREYSIDEILNEPYFVLMDTIKLRRYFERAIKEYEQGGLYFFKPKMSNFKLGPNDKIVKLNSEN